MQFCNCQWLMDWAQVLGPCGRHNVKSLFAVGKDIFTANSL